MIELDKKDMYAPGEKGRQCVVEIILRYDKLDHWQTYYTLYSNTPKDIRIDVNIIEDVYDEDIIKNYTKISSFPCIIVQGYAMSLEEYLATVSANRFVFNGVDLYKEQAKRDEVYGCKEAPEPFEPCEGPLRAGIDYDPKDAELSPEEKWEWFSQHGDD